MLPGQTDNRGVDYFFLGYEYSSTTGKWISERNGLEVEYLNLQRPKKKEDQCPFTTYGKPPEMKNRPTNLCTVCLLNHHGDNQYKMIGIESEFLSSFFDTSYSFYYHRNGMVQFK